MLFSIVITVIYLFQFSTRVRLGRRSNADSSFKTGLISIPDSRRIWFFRVAVQFTLGRLEYFQRWHNKAMYREKSEGAPANEKDRDDDCLCKQSWRLHLFSSSFFNRESPKYIFFYLNQSKMTAACADRVEDLHIKKSVNLTRSCPCCIAVAGVRGLARTVRGLARAVRGLARTVRSLARTARILARTVRGLARTCESVSSTVELWFSNAYTSCSTAFFYRSHSHHCCTDRTNFSCDLLITETLRWRPTCEERQAVDLHTH